MPRDIIMTAAALPSAAYSQAVKAAGLRPEGTKQMWVPNCSSLNLFCEQENEEHDGV